MTTHAVATTEGAGEPGIGLSLLRNLDLVLLAVALPVFVFADLPLVGYAAIAIAWGIQRWVSAFAQRKAVESGDRRTAMGVIGGTMVARLWLLGLSILAAGLIEREAGLAAALLAAVVFTASFVALLITKPMEDARR